MSWLCHMLVNGIFCFMLQDVFFVFFQPLFCLTSCFADVADWAIWAFNMVDDIFCCVCTSILPVITLSLTKLTPLKPFWKSVHYLLHGIRKKYWNSDCFGIITFQWLSEENDRKTTEETHGTKAPSSTRKIENCLCSLYKRNIWTYTKNLKEN